MSTTIPACRVEAAPSRPARYPGPLTMMACRCGGIPADPSPATTSVVPAGSPAVMSGQLHVSPPHRGRAGPPIATGPARKRTKIHHGQRAPGQHRPADRRDRRQVGTHRCRPGQPAPAPHQAPPPSRSSPSPQPRPAAPTGDRNGNHGYRTPATASPRPAPARAPPPGQAQRSPPGAPGTGPYRHAAPAPGPPHSASATHPPGTYAEPPRKQPATQPNPPAPPPTKPASPTPTHHSSAAPATPR